MDNKRKTILMTGASGYVGSVLLEKLLGKGYTIHVAGRTKPKQFGNNVVFVNLDLSTASKKEIDGWMKSTDAKILVHLAALVDQDSEWEWVIFRRGLPDPCPSYKTNYLATQKLIKACEESGKRIVYSGTGCVYGDNLSFHSLTKKMAKESIESSAVIFAILEFDHPCGVEVDPKDGKKPDFIQGIISGLRNLKSGEALRMASDYTISPTWIYDIVDAFLLLIENNIGGLYQLAGEKLKYSEVAVMIARKFGYPINAIEEISLEQFRQTVPDSLRTKWIENAKVVLGNSFNKEIEKEIVNLKRAPRQQSSLITSSMLYKLGLNPKNLDFILDNYKFL